jgi:hypothetical protein
MHGLVDLFKEMLDFLGVTEDNISYRAEVMEEWDPVRVTLDVHAQDTTLTG